MDAVELLCRVPRLLRNRELQLLGGKEYDLHPFIGNSDPERGTIIRDSYLDESYLNTQLQPRIQILPIIFSDDSAVVLAHLDKIFMITTSLTLSPLQRNGGSYCFTAINPSAGLIQYVQHRLEEAIGYGINGEYNIEDVDRNRFLPLYGHIDKNWTLFLDTLLNNDPNGHDIVILSLKDKLYDLLLSILITRDNGILVAELPDNFTNSHLGAVAIYLTALCYDSLYLYKPITSSKIWMIGANRKQSPDIVTDLFQDLIETNSITTYKLPESFTQWLIQRNNSIYQADKSYLENKERYNPYQLLIEVSVPIASEQ